MSGLFGGSSRANTPAPLATNLRIQTSIQGTPIPFGYGTNRLAPNLLYYPGADFISLNQIIAGAAGGKGGIFGGGNATNTNTNNYFATIIFGLCEGPVDSIAQIWQGKNITNLNALNMSFFNGSYTQTAWGYVASKFPADARAYRGIAYFSAALFNLGTSPDLPSLNAEVSFGFFATGAPQDANPRDIIVDFCTNDKYGVLFPANRIGDTNLSTLWNYCQAVGIWMSPVLIQAKAANGFLADILWGCVAEPVWSGGVLKIVPYYDAAASANGGTYAPNLAPLFDLTDDDFIIANGSYAAPVIARPKATSDIYNKITVKYPDRIGGYNPTPVEAKDDASIQAFGLRARDPKQMDAFCLATSAQTCAHLQLGREQIPVTYEFTVGQKYVLLDPMDLVSLTDSHLGLARQLVRIKEITENQDLTLTIMAEAMLVGAASPPIYGTQANTGFVPMYNAPAGAVAPPLLFEPTAELLGGADEQVWAAVTGADLTVWGGCYVWASYDGVNYKQIEGRLIGPSIMGVTTADFLPVDVNLVGQTIDQTNTLSVDLAASEGQLTSGSLSDVLALNTACWVDGEVVAYQNATLTGTNAYDLTYLVRGGFGTEANIIDHPSGSPFVRLNAGIFGVPFDKTRIGATLFLKFQSYNRWGGGLQDLTDCAAYTYAITGVALGSPLPIIQNLTSVFVAGRLNLSWDEVSDFRSGIRYEVRKGSSFEGGLSLGTVAHPPFPVPAGSGDYWVSAWCQPAPALIVRSELPVSIAVSGATVDSNVIATFDFKALGWPGIFTNTGIDSGLDAVRTAGANDILTDANILVVPDLLNEGGNVSGIYDPDTLVDVGRVIDSAVTCLTLGTGEPVGQNILGELNVLVDEDILGAASAAFVDVFPEIAFAQDNTADLLSDPDVLNDTNIFEFGINFGPWQKYAPGRYLGRVFKPRWRLNTLDPNTIALLLEAQFYVDVPDRIDHVLTDDTIPGAGEVIVFEPDGSAIPAPFNGGPNGATVPQIIASWGDEQPGDVLSYTGLSKAGVFVQVLNGGVGVQRDKFNLFARGW